MNEKPFYIKQALSFGYSSFKVHFKNLSLLTLIYLASEIVILFLQYVVMPNESELFYNGLGFIFSVFNMGLALGMARIMLNIHDGVEYKINYIFQEFHYLPRYFVASVLLAILILIGLIFLILPGIYIAITCQFFYFFIIENDSKIIDSLKLSMQIARKYFWQLLLFELACLGLNILGLAALVIGIFITLWITALANVFVYRKLLELANDNIKEEQSIITL